MKCKTCSSDMLLIHEKDQNVVDYFGGEQFLCVCPECLRATQGSSKEEAIQRYNDGYSDVDYSDG